MARVRIMDQSNLKNWEEVNLTLAEIGEKQRGIEEIETRLNAQIAELKLEASTQVAPMEARIKQLELQLKNFVDEHLEDLGKKKSKELTFGVLGYRKSTKAILPKAAAKIQEIIAALKARGMNDCVITQPDKIDKEALKKYPASDVLAVGVNLKVDDTFWYEIDQEKLTEKGAAAS